MEVNSGLRRAHAEGLDAGSLVGLLSRYREGETYVWSTVNMSCPRDEDQRHLHREVVQLRRERTNHRNRVRGLLAAIGIREQRHAFQRAPLAGLYLPSIALCVAGVVVYGTAGCVLPLIRGP